MEAKARVYVGPGFITQSVLRTEPGIYQYRAWQNVTVGVWVGQATGPAVRGLFEIGPKMAQHYPAGHSSVVFILDKLPAPTPEARELLTRIMSGRGDLQCTAIVLEGSGFWASGLRSMLGNTHRAASGTLKLRVSTSIDEVIDWLPAEHERSTGVALDPAQLKVVLGEIREQAERAARA